VGPEPAVEFLPGRDSRQPGFQLADHALGGSSSLPSHIHAGRMGAGNLPGSPDLSADTLTCQTKGTP